MSPISADIVIIKDDKVIPIWRSKVSDVSGVQVFGLEIEVQGCDNGLSGGVVPVTQTFLLRNSDDVFPFRASGEVHKRQIVNNHEGLPSLSTLEPGRSKSFDLPSVSVNSITIIDYAKNINVPIDSDKFSGRQLSLRVRGIRRRAKR